MPERYLVLLHSCYYSDAYGILTQIITYLLFNIVLVESLMLENENNPYAFTKKYTLLILTLHFFRWLFSARQAGLLLLMCWLYPASALTVSEQTPGLQPGAEVKIWMDASRALPVEAVAEKLSEFQSPQGKLYARGYSRNAMWMSFSLQNPDAKLVRNYLEYTEAQIGAVSLYTRIAGGPWQQQHFHAAQSEFTRPFATVRPVFLQEIPANSQLDVLIRVIYSENEDMAGPLVSDIRVWGERDFMRANSREMLLWGGMVGIMFLVAFAALAVFSASRDKTFLFYGLKLLTLTFAHLSATGVMPLFFWQGQYSLTLLYVLSGFYYICAAQFVRYYLKTSQITPRLDIALKGIIAFGVISILSALFGFTQFTLLTLEIGGVGFLLHIVVSLYAVRYGVSGAKLFALAWTIYTASITVTWGLRGSAVLEHTPFTYRFNSISIVIEILLFSMAMALRVAEMNRQKEQLEQAYRLQLEKEASELEALVMQRTYELDLARRDAEAASLAKGHFLAHVSHEIRTPLTSILGYVDQLKHDDSLNALQVKSLSRIADSGDYLLSLIGNVLNVSKLEVGLEEIDESSIDIEVLIRQLRALFEEQAKNKKIDFLIYSEVQGSFLLDSGKLRQILVNLLGNAIKFTETGSVQLGLSLADKKGRLCLIADVIDTGSGIAEADYQKVFAPFEQTLQGKRAGGAGLGLSICKDFAHLMGGDIQLISVLGQGTHFTLTVPVHAKDARPLPQPVAPKWRLDGLHILIAEDQEVNRELLQELLCSVGASVTACEDGLSAMSAWRCDPEMDAVLLDYHMPLMNGMQVSRSLRALGFKGRVFLVSAGHSPQAEMLAAAGIDHWIAKPYNRETLFSALQQQPMPVVPAMPADLMVLDLDQAGKALAYTLERCVSMAKKGLERIDLLLNTLDQETLPENARRHAHSARGIAGQIAAHQLSATLGLLENEPERADLRAQARADLQQAILALQQWQQQLAGEN